MAKQKVIAQKEKKRGVSTKRFLWADVIRVLAIFLVVQIHVSSLFRHDIFPHNIFYPITVISVPLFILLSGALLLGKEESYKTFFTKRCLKVLLPWIVWTGIYMYFDYNFRIHDRVIIDFFSTMQSSIEQWMRYFLSTFLSRLWFLPLIFSLYLLTPLFRVFVKNASKKDLLYGLVLWFIFVSLLPIVYPSPLFPTYEPSLMLAPFQYAGYFIGGYFISAVYSPKHNRFWLLLFVTVPFIVLPILANISSTEIIVDRYLSPGAVIATFFTFILLCYLSAYIEKWISPLAKRIIISLSGASLGIYLIHEIVLFCLLNSFPQIVAIGVGGVLVTVFLLSASAVLVLKKVPGIKYLLP